MRAEAKQGKNSQNQERTEEKHNRTKGEEKQGNDRRNRERSGVIEIGNDTQKEA